MASPTTPANPALSAAPTGPGPGPDAHPTYVVIPVRNHLDLTMSLVDQLHAQGGFASIVVFDNGSTDGTSDWLADQHAAGRLEAIGAAGMTLHQMWNAGSTIARARHPRPNIAILNNDLVIGPEFCARLSRALRADPALYAVSPAYDDAPRNGVRYVSSTFKNGGLAGFAFMVRGEVLATMPFDEELRWWYGDDDLVAQIEASGHRVGITDATCVEHVNGGSQTIGYTPDVVYDLEHDVLHMYQKWGHT